MRLHVRPAEIQIRLRVAVWSESLQGTLWVAKPSSYRLWRLWSECADAHMQSCRKCCAPALMQFSHRIHNDTCNYRDIYILPSVLLYQASRRQDTNIPVIIRYTDRYYKFLTRRLKMASWHYDTFIISAWIFRKAYFDHVHKVNCPSGYMTF